MILVIGANGRVGGLVADGLVEHNIRPRVLVRDTGKSLERFGDQVEIAQGDLADRASVDQAMKGVETVFLCSPVDPDQVRLQGHVVDAAVRNEAFVVKLSGLGTFDGSYVDSGAWHAETEAQIRKAGVGHTFLHPYFFMENLLFSLPLAKKQGVIRSAVGDAVIAMVAVSDIAEAAIKVLMDPSIAPGRTLPLTERVARSYADIAQALSESLGREILYEEQTDAEVEQNLKAAGQPDWHVRLLLQFNRAFREGLGSEPDMALEDLLGRAPLTVEEILERSSGSSGDNPFPS